MGWHSLLFIACCLDAMELENERKKWFEAKVLFYGWNLVHSLGAIAADELLMMNLRPENMNFWIPLTAFMGRNHILSCEGLQFCEPKRAKIAILHFYVPCCSFYQKKEHIPVLNPSTPLKDPEHTCFKSENPNKK